MQLSETREILLGTGGAKKVLIVSHRGSVRGGIPENTVAAFELALKNHADILEADVARTQDGTLVISHDRILARFTDGHGLISEHNSAAISELNLISSMGYPTQFKMNTLDELLEHFKGKCLINLDQCEKFMEEAYAAVKRHKMLDQILFKSGDPLEKSLGWFESHECEALFMPIIKEESDMNQFLTSSKTKNIPAVEIVMKNSNISLVKPETIQALHELGKCVWINSLSISSALPGEYGDNIAILEDENVGWGWVLEHGADIIQTDWVLELHNYLIVKGLH